jgi:hypothetical protein
MANDSRQEIQDWLTQQGYSREEIDTVLKKVEEYDTNEVHDSWFDSIGGGEFSIHKIIREALGKEPNSPST